MSVRLFLSILAAVLHGTGYLTYNIQIFTGVSHPNAASWTVWAFLAILNALSFRSISGTTASLQFITGSVACTLTFCYALIGGKFAPLRPLEWVVLALSLCAVVVWWWKGKATYANRIILVAFVISFVPTIVSVIRDVGTERPLAWVLWTCACLLTSVGIVVSRKASWDSLAMPAILTIAHGAIMVLCW